MWIKKEKKKQCYTETLQMCTVMLLKLSEFFFFPALKGFHDNVIKLLKKYKLCIYFSDKGLKCVCKKIKTEQWLLKCLGTFSCISFFCLFCLWCGSSQLFFFKGIGIQPCQPCPFTQKLKCYPFNTVAFDNLSSVDVNNKNPVDSQNQSTSFIPYVYTV